MFRCTSLRKNRIPWKRHVSPAHRRVQETQRGNWSDLYRLDIHRANCSSGCRASAACEVPSDVTIRMRSVGSRRGYDKGVSEESNASEIRHGRTHHLLSPCPSHWVPEYMIRSASIVLRRRGHASVIRVLDCVNVGKKCIPFCAAICAASLRFLELYPRFEGPVLTLTDKNVMN